MTASSNSGQERDYTPYIRLSGGYWLCIDTDRVSESCNAHSGVSFGKKNFLAIFQAKVHKVFVLFKHNHKGGACGT